MPYKRNHKRRRRRRGYGGTRNLAKTLRARQRKKVGLNTRVTLANRQQIRKLSKATETKMNDRIQGEPVNDFDGQFQDSIVVDKDGVDVPSNQVFSPSLLRLTQGDGAYQRIGQWVQMKSLTMKYCITSDIGSGPDQRMYMMLVLDREGDRGSGSSLADVLNLFAVAPPPANQYALAFQNLNNTGKDGRFKILWKKSHKLSSWRQTAANVGSIVTNPAVSAGTTYGNVTRTNYNNYQFTSAQYPERVYGSVTIKRPYKLNYTDEGTERSPENQTIRLYAWSESTQTPDGSRAVLQYYCRFRFKDA